MKRLFLILVTLLMFSACREPGTAANAGAKTIVTPEVINNLLRRSLDDIVYVNGGSFIMGDGDEDGNGLPWTIDKDNKPGHKVSLDSYYIGKHEVTYGEHDIFTAAMGREPTLKKFWGNPWRQPELAAGVAWNDAKAYCEWLGDKTGLPLDLPTEAQWEYAARNRGQNIPFATDSGFLDIGRNYPNHLRQANPPAQYPPNPLGITDMSGNVIEWVDDWYDPNYYKSSPIENPKGPENGKKKIRRGGSFNESPEGGNVFTRQELEPKEVYTSTGFRCALNVSDPPEKLKARAAGILKNVK